MNFVIPMAGKGSRFAKAGYNIPKYLIEVKGRTLLEYSLNSLPLEIADHIIFIALEDHINNHNLREVISNLLPGKNISIISLSEYTNGQAETVLTARNYINNSNDLIIYNIDTYFQSPTLKSKLLSPEKKDGILGYFKDDAVKWSFAKVNSDNIVTETAEKIVISDNALTGLYHFTNGSDFVRVAERAIASNQTSSNEFYIAPLYNYLISEGKQFVLDYAAEFIALGTPEDVAAFKEN